MSNAADLLAAIHALPLNRVIRIMNVCGGHERSISQAGLRSLLPPQIELIAGPGCPVCICPEEDIHAAIELALRHDVTVLAFGDMLRVPVNGPKAGPRTLEQAKTMGADVRPLASPLDAVRIARQQPAKETVFFAAGFETTMAPLAAMLAEGVPPNLSILLSGRQTWPAVAMLLESGEAALDALIAPGHVATVMGAEQWRFVAERHGLPVAVAGFSAASLLAAILAVLQQLQAGRSGLYNSYPELVRPHGNRQAQTVMQQVFDVVPGEWRGIGVIADSAYGMRCDWQTQDARQRFPLAQTERTRAGQMPPGCDCAAVVLGRKTPVQCRLYGTACTPAQPVGPCMVSDEGACRIWWATGQRAAAHSSPLPSSRRGS